MEECLPKRQAWIPIIPAPNGRLALGLQAWKSVIPTHNMPELEWSNSSMKIKPENLPFMLIICLYQNGGMAIQKASLNTYHSCSQLENGFRNASQENLSFLPIICLYQKGGMALWIVSLETTIHDRSFPVPGSLPFDLGVIWHVMYWHN